MKKNSKKKGTVDYNWIIKIVVSSFLISVIFTLISETVIPNVGIIMGSILTLIFITYISSLINANDMALLTFLPLAYLVLKYTNQTQYLAFTFIMQNVASNLGGMFSPIGNPQNIYLFSFFGYLGS